MTRPGAPQYLYGVVRTGAVRRDALAGLDGLDRRPVREIPWRDVAALASDAPPAPIPTTRANLTAHLDVLRAAAARVTVLPLRFGTVLPGEDEVRDELLAPRHRVLDRLLRRLDGLVEIDVKAYYREDAVLREIVTEQPAIRRLDAAIRRAGGASSYPDRIRLGELVVAAMAEKAGREGERLLRRLARAASRSQAGPRQVERMVLNAAFLVPRGEVGAFDREVERIEAEAGHRLHLRATGPMPPASFVSVDLDDRRAARAAGRR
jgi:Gas vesicle synthesis protein GvpL/GvpF